MKALPNSEGTPFVLHNDVKTIVNTDKNGNVIYPSDEIIQGRHSIIVEYKLNDGHSILSNEIIFHIIRNMKLDFEKIISQISQPSIQQIEVLVEVSE